MKNHYQGYIYLSVLQEQNQWDWIAIKTNKEGKTISTFGVNERNLSFSKRLQSFTKWIGNVTQYRMVSFGHSEYQAFFSNVERSYADVFPRHLIRMMKSQLWNIKSECMYRFQITKDVTIEELLFLYKQDYIHHPNPLMETCLNLQTLANLFLFDTTQTKKLMKKSKVLTIQESYERFSVEDLLFFLFQNGVCVNILPHEQHQKGMLVSFQRGSEDTVFSLKGTNLKDVLVEALLQIHPLNT